MTIKGLENIYDRAVARAILSFIYDNITDVEEVNIDEGEEEYEYIINDDHYLIISTDDEHNTIDSFNEDEYNEALYGNVSEEWRPYLNKDKWIEDNGIGRIEEWWDAMHSTTVLTYITKYDGINIYSIE